MQGFRRAFSIRLKNPCLQKSNRACQELARVHTIERACEATRGASSAAQAARPLLMSSMAHKNLEST